MKKLMFFFQKKHLSVLITEDFFDDEEYKYL